MGFEDLVEHIVGSTRLDRDEAARLIAEVVAYFAETPEQFVIRRHTELQAESHKNDAIFEHIAQELAGRRFAAPLLSRRQMRRIVYG